MSVGDTVLFRNRVQREMTATAIFVAAKRAKREQPENKPRRDYVYPNLLDDFLHCCCLIAVSWSTVLPGCKLEGRISVVCCIGNVSINCCTGVLCFICMFMYSEHHLRAPVSALCALRLSSLSVLECVCHHIGSVQIALQYYARNTEPHVAKCLCAA
jgi:hypothetical protein